MWHRYSRDPLAAGPKRLCVVPMLQAAKPGYDSKVFGTHSQPLNPMEAIKPFILYA